MFNPPVIRTYTLISMYICLKTKITDLLIQDNGCNFLGLFHLFVLTWSKARRCSGRRWLNSSLSTNWMAKDMERTHHLREHKKLQRDKNVWFLSNSSRLTYRRKSYFFLTHFDQLWQTKNKMLKIVERLCSKYIFPLLVCKSNMKSDLSICHSKVKALKNQPTQCFDQRCGEHKLTDDIVLWAERIHHCLVPVTSEPLNDDLKHPKHDVNYL